MKPIFAAAAVSLLATAALPAFAQEHEAPYVDDRSNAAQLTRSLYSAISRKEYARAWDYFGEEKPAPNFEAFVDGYKDTQRVNVVIGVVSEEGAAGSSFFEIPVAIEAFDADGAGKVFAGCYTARLTQPQLQEPPFRGMHIEKGSLKAVEGNNPFESLPKTCGDAPAASAEDLAREIALREFKAGYRGVCATLGSSPISIDPSPEVWPLKFRYPYESDADPETTIHLVRFACNMAAYNTTEVFYAVDQYGQAQAMSFAHPDLDVRYENDDTTDKVKSVTIIGYTSSDQQVNSEFSPDEKAIYASSKWRGIGDASSSGKWLFRSGQFTLVHYEVDASYDGEANPETVLDFDSGP
ncbi:MAG: DUF1176 domain-containing protein [Rhizobiaceae bacterium]